MDTEQIVPEKKNGNGQLTALTNKLQKILETKPARVAIFTHGNPDPDAIGSMMGMQWLLQQYQIESELFYTGEIAHPQNQAMVNLLDPGMLRCEHFGETPYDLKILVDTVPNHAGTDDKEVVFDLVIDHHKETVDADFKGLFINLRAGSACGTVYALISKLKLSFEADNENDSRVSTALMVGISTDTENLMSADSTDYEFDAWSNLFQYKNPAALSKIVNWERPKLWVDIEAEAAKTARVVEGIGVVGLGLISKKHRDIIAHTASQMVLWENVNTAVAFALIDGNRIEGSIRSKNASMSVPVTCKELGTERSGNGGGKLGKGAYSYDLAGASLTEDDDEDTKIKTWNLFNDKEYKRVLRIIKNGG
jgi:nanoRNase/pAp phosphatase (c-di-AMP/oligoRNAs hydrolase)